MQRSLLVSVFSFILPLIPMQKENFLQIDRSKHEDPNLAKIPNDFYKMIGVTSWERKLLKIEDKDYILETVSCNNLRDFFFRFHYFMILKLPIAMWLYHIYKDCTGVDFLLEDHFPKVSLLFEKSSTDYNPARHSANDCFVLPISPSKVALLEASLEQVKTSLKLPLEIKNLKVHHQEVSEGKHVILVQTFSSKKVSLNLDSLPLGQAELTSIFDKSYVYFPVTFENQHVKMLS